MSVALYDTALAWNAYHIAGYLDTGYVPRPMGSELPMIAPYGAFETADGEIMIAAGNDGLFRRLCTSLSLELPIDDERFSSNAARVAHRDAVNEAVSSRTRSLDTADLLALLRGHGVPCAPILDVAQVSADEQTLASGMVDQSNGATALKLPIRFNGTRAEAGPPPPRAGQHTAAILSELGME